MPEEVKTLKDALQESGLDSVPLTQTTPENLPACSNCKDGCEPGCQPGKV